MSADYYHLLFVDQDNASLSIMAEKLLQHWGKERFRVYSAGLNPVESVDPQVIRLLQSKKLDIENIRSKSLEEYQRDDSPPLDFVIGLSDGQDIAIPDHWQPAPVFANWNLHDLITEDTSQESQSQHLKRTYSFLENRIKIFTNLKLGNFNNIALSQKLNALGNFKLNDELMDREHAMFQFLIQRLEQAASQQASSDALLNIAMEVQKYTLFHFFSEENYMESVGYPKLDEHSAQHARLTADLNEKLFKAKAGHISIQSLCTFLKGWFLDHVVEDDARFAEYLREHSLH